MPSAYYFPNATKYVAKEYLDRQKEAPLSGAIMAYLEKVLLKAFTHGYPNYRSDIKERGQMICMLTKLYDTIPTDQASNSLIFLFSHAAFYEHTKVGTCSYRASYAALQLSKILEGTSSVVALQSAPAVDHFTVLLGNKNEGYYVYDALTNPVMLFDREFYIKSILPTFTPATHRPAPMNFRITPQVLELYTKQLPTIKEEFTNLLRTYERDPSKLLQDPAYLICLKKKKKR